MGELAGDKFNDLTQHPSTEPSMLLTLQHKMPSRYTRSI